MFSNGQDWYDQRKVFVNHLSKTTMRPETLTGNLDVVLEGMFETIEGHLETRIVVESIFENSLNEMIFYMFSNPGEIFLTNVFLLFIANDASI